MALEKTKEVTAAVSIEKSHRAVSRRSPELAMWAPEPGIDGRILRR